MKTIKLISGKCIMAFILLSVFNLKTDAQSAADNLHFNVDWQMNAPVGTSFANKISGWGMNFEGGYYVSPHWSVGTFLNFHTNHRYVQRQTISLSPTAAVTTDQQQSAYQLPFGLTTSYKIADNGLVKPYIGVKLGAMYAKNTTFLNSKGYYDDPWGFYVSPEVGLNIHPVRYGRFGFHIALYYSYATNQSKLLTDYQDGQNNLGFRLGVCF